MGGIVILGTELHSVSITANNQKGQPFNEGCPV
jgi:hypothetical protein